MQQPLAIAVIGGLITNMLLTRLLIPVGYLALEEVRTILRGIFTGRWEAQRSLNAAPGPRGEESAMARVLVVEDQKRHLDSLRRGLEAEGYEVVTASTGEEGLARATGEAVNAIVLDLMLPGRDGMNDPSGAAVERLRPIRS